MSEYKPVSISLPSELEEYLENESGGIFGKRSAIIQEELKNRIQRQTYEKKLLQPLLLFLVIGIISISSIFSFLLIPTTLSFFPYMIVLATSTVILCFFGIYRIQQQKVKTWM